LKNTSKVLDRVFQFAVIDLIQYICTCVRVCVKRDQGTFLPPNTNTATMFNTANIVRAASRVALRQGTIHSTIRSFAATSWHQDPRKHKAASSNGFINVTGKNWDGSALLKQTDENITEKYDLGRVSGRGRFGKVQEATCLKTGDRVAVKTIPMRNIYEHETLLNEIEILANNDHPNLMSSIETVVTSNHVHIVSDFFEGGELYDRIVGREQYTFTREEIIVVMYQILTGLKEMHENNVTHRDIKPENVMFKEEDGWELALIDFGMAMEVNPNEVNGLSGKAGSPSYVAPEVIGEEYDERADCWSAGVIMYVLSCGKAPFKGKSSEDTIELIRAGKYCVRAEEWTSLCDDVRDVVQGLLQTDPADRLTAKEALEQDLFEDFRSADAGGLGMDRGATKDLVFI
jgi:serine/threonine protein kinase